MVTILMLYEDPRKDGDIPRELEGTVNSSSLRSCDLVYYSVSPERITKSKINKNRIEKILDTCKPKVVITFGKLALEAMMIQNVSHTEVCNIPQKVYKYLVYPTYSLQVLLSYATGYKGITLLQRQFERVYELANAETFEPFSENHYKKFIHVVSDNADEAIAWCESQRYLAFDIETAGYNVPKEAQLNPEHPHAEITVIGIGNREKVYVFNTHILKHYIPKIKAVLEMKKTFLTWNGNFDIGFLKALWNVNITGQVIDGRICQYLEDISRQYIPHSGTLKFCSALMLPQGAWYAGYEKHGGISDAIKDGDAQFITDHISQFELYCGIDVYVTYKTTAYLYALLTEQQKKLTTDFYPPLIDTLGSISKGGIKVNVLLLNENIKALSKFIKEIEEHVEKTYPDFNMRSSKQLAHILYEEKKLPERRTDKGQLSTSVEVLEEFGETDSFCRLMAVARGFEKQLQLFKTVKETIFCGYIHPEYLYSRTTSGRLSCINPNVQQFPAYKRLVTNVSEEPKDLRSSLGRPPWCKAQVKKTDKGDYEIIETSPNFKECFIVDPDCIGIMADYSQLEIFALAYYINLVSTDRTLQKALQEGMDIHSYTASLVFSVLKKIELSYEFVKANKEKEPYKTWRKLAKSIIFKMLYGGQSKTFSEEYGLTLEQGKEIWDTFKRVIPGIVDYETYQRKSARDNGYVTSIQGHIRSLPVYEVFKREYQYISKAQHCSQNHPIQSTASILVEEVLIELHKRLKGLHKNARILLTIHDSIWIQVPTEMEKQGIEIMKYCMVQYIQEKHPDFITGFPLKIDMEKGKSWGLMEKIK